ncbi:hypothetical protein BAOM_3030 [Peribacillus asahii]|uniref:Uncharacterized protein n=1 Tax=Peribacillus asahii TaxID=228899 RepID=A0A3Q9RK88_9BACI|nr:hypothetical protein [Peribacillus asahii]AZV43639.1 hypothetical protein BAOM_3030 [Peribacillus asahii]
MISESMLKFITDSKALEVQLEEKLSKKEEVYSSWYASEESKGLMKELYNFQNLNESYEFSVPIAAPVEKDQIECV